MIPQGHDRGRDRAERRGDLEVALPRRLFRSGGDQIARHQDQRRSLAHQRRDRLFVNRVPRCAHVSVHDEAQGLAGSRRGLEHGPRRLHATRRRLVGGGLGDDPIPVASPRRQPFDAHDLTHARGRGTGLLARAHAPNGPVTVGRVLGHQLDAAARRQVRLPRDRHSPVRGRDQVRPAHDAQAGGQRKGDRPGRSAALGNATAHRVNLDGEHVALGHQARALRRQRNIDRLGVAAVRPDRARRRRVCRHVAAGDLDVVQEGDEPVLIADAELEHPHRVRRRDVEALAKIQRASGGHVDGRDALGWRLGAERGARHDAARGNGPRGVVEAARGPPHGGDAAEHTRRRRLLIYHLVGARAPERRQHHQRRDGDRAHPARQGRGLGMGTVPAGIVRGPRITAAGGSSPPAICVQRRLVQHRTMKTRIGLWG